MLRSDIDFERVLARLARSNVVAEGTVFDIVQFLIEQSAEALGVSRVSVWKFDEPHTALNCLSAYDAEQNTNCTGEHLTIAECPSYFAALEELRTIDAMNAESDPRTRELREVYLNQHRITTMLDAPLFLQGRVIGVVCHEHAGTPRRWTDIEKIFAGSIADFISVSLEAERRIIAERRLRETEQLLSIVAEYMSDGFALLEPDEAVQEFIIRYVNKSGAAMYGYAPDELVGKPTQVIRVPEHHTELFEQSQRALANDNQITYETLTKRKDNTEIAVEVNLNLVEHERKKMAVVVGRDISERRAAEQSRVEAQSKALQAQRLESLGLFAGKIAHDFNNLLVGILGNVSLAARKSTENSEVKNYLNNIESTAQIAADLSRQILTYSGQQGFELSRLDLTEIINEMSVLLQVTLPKNVQLILKTDAGVPAINAEPTQIRQIALNLVANAADALVEKAGEITVKTYAFEFSPEGLAGEQFDVRADDLPGGSDNLSFVCLEVRDNGVGMDEATRATMFTPFFTTKATGHGLGMATLSNIVRAHRGAIRVTSEPGRGTAVRVLFPTVVE